MKNYTEFKLIKIINDSLRTCTVCKKANTRGGNFISSDCSNIDVMFIAQNPGYSIFDQNKQPEDTVPFALHDDKIEYHQFFDKFIIAFQKEFGREPIFYITNIVKCTTFKNQLDDQEMISTCVRKYLLKELKFFTTLYSCLPIVTLGTPAREVTSKFSDFKNLKIKHMTHPGYLNRQPRIQTDKAVSELIDYIKMIRESKVQSEESTEDVTNI